MDPVVDFNLDSLKSDEDGGQGDTAENSITYPPLDHDKDFELHTLVANRDIEVGEVLFHESPIVTYYMAYDPDTLQAPACHNCFKTIRTGLVPCPWCSTACFCR